MKVQELREKSSKELLQLEAQLRKELFKLRLTHFSGEGEFARVAEFKSKRREIARIKTILTEREKSLT